MQTSQQATNRLHWPRDASYPFRCIVLVEHIDGLWSVTEIFEMETEGAAYELGEDAIAGPFTSGVVAMHYYVGEVA
jgi:hypothetical protein